MNVKNRKCIRKLSLKSLYANRRRNLIAIFAIALTTLLFTSCLLYTSCVEDGIDSSKDSGKLMISVLSAVAEIERENILVQTMEGRKQKAREGKWNGGFAPYGYELVNGELQIAEDEAEIIRLIYDKFIHTNMGCLLYTSRCV